MFLQKQNICQFPFSSYPLSLFPFIIFFYKKNKIAYKKNYKSLSLGLSICFANYNSERSSIFNGFKGFELGIPLAI